MSQLYVPGPAQLFVGTGNSQALVFLGYTQEGVDINLRGNWLPVISDVAGPTTPIDRQFFPESADFTFRLTEYNEQVLQAYACRTFGGIAGALQANQAGSLLVQENLGFPFAIRCPYAVKTAFSATMVSGYYFPVTAVDDDIVPISTRTKLPQLTVFAQWSISQVNLNGSLYSNTLPTLPSVN
jgi:hypothetical protein